MTSSSSFDSAASRRQFVESLARTAFGVSILPLADSAFGAAAKAGNPAAQSAQHVIYLFMSGAMSHIDTFDPKPDKEEGGETSAIQTSLPGIQIGEHLPRLAERMNQLALIRSMTTETGAHEQGRYLMRTSYQMSGSIRHPFLGSWMTHFKETKNRDLPGSVIVGNGNRHPAQGFLSAEVAPAPVGNPAKGLQNTKSPRYLKEKYFEKRRRLIGRFEAPFRRKYKTKEVEAYGDYYSEAVRLLKSPDLVAFDISKEKDEVKETYGATRIGQGCLLARRLVEKGVRFVEVEFGGWDNHNNLYDGFSDRAGQLDVALSALLVDLKQRGLLSTTLIALGSEFGRSPKMNANAGRNHHPGAFSTLLAGAGIKGGQVIGRTDAIGKTVDEDACSPADFNATIAAACGLPYDRKVETPNGRTFTMTDEGQPVQKLLG